MSKLTIGLSGKDNLTRNAAANFIVAKYLNAKIKQDRFNISRISKEFRLVDSFNSNKTIPIDYPNSDLDNLTRAYSVKVYTFADPVKKFCCENLGLDVVQCFGSEKDQDTNTHIFWDDAFDQIRVRHAKPRRGTSELKPASGPMTAKEVMDMVEHDMFRAIDPNCWTRSLYSMIEKDNYDLSVIMNLTKANEVAVGTEVGAKIIRFTKKSGKEPMDELDDLPLGEYSLVLENQDLTPIETNKKIQDYILQCFRDRRII